MARRSFPVKKFLRVESRTSRSPSDDEQYYFMSGEKASQFRQLTCQFIQPLYELRKPFLNFALGVVLRSENPKYKTGDHVYGFLGSQAYIIYHDVPPLTILPVIENLPWSVYAGTLGMAGQTTYIGWKLYSKATKGETMFISTAAGPVGSAVVQITKDQGLKVVVSAGSDEKVEFIKSIGVGIAFNYKSQDTRAVLENLGTGVDIFWDNASYLFCVVDTLYSGILEIAIDLLNVYGRLINCESISQHNTETKYGIKNLLFVMLKSLSMSVPIASNHFDLLGEFYIEFPQKVFGSEIKYTGQRHQGWEQVGQAILNVQKRQNKAKAVLVVASELFSHKL
ncbi:hypothetical protein M422DRAFT_270569 [Sphaerobolus stellatus SS14]|uniref:Enoyl reductase (ER) domain-containing protein n=1 Tax=Sphaerobolus stellatus (strain SS14) TaxID=990650 RepID=A0A0C9U226_SPHS4|nr:hypothetical protein M422DRAFT_270569 [Sphaerobolus stellatus SS14]